MKYGLYEHYKGFQYHVIATCRHSETLEEMVVYRALYGEYGLWVRPKTMFLEMVEVKGSPLPRFRYIREMEEEEESGFT